MRLVFEDFAAEEKKHKQILQAIKDEKLLLDDPPQPTYLKISDYSIYDETFDPNGVPSEKDLQKAYVMAMKKEKAAFKLYTRLAEQTTHEESRKLFSALAQEEAKHRLRIEIEYDDAFLADN